ncbi:MAG TPA: UDP-N-acetylglucosamine 2-epimerase (non-hydrolyzing) [Gemmatimonadales bacterium]
MHVVGARPNFPKLAPVHRAATRAGLSQMVIHTGQHYDDALYRNLLRDLELPAPEIDLGVGSASHGAQTARILERIEPVIAAHRPRWLVVYGDVNSTVAAALAAAKLGVRVAHVEAGLRSGDRSMPEEINRIVTDRIADLLLTPSRDADRVLRAEGEPEEEIVFVGNVMIDSLFRTIERLDGRASVTSGRAGHAVVTLHRPSNVDDPGRVAAIAAALREVAAERDVVFPMHPRTREAFARAGARTGAVEVLGPLDYPDMVALVRDAAVVITDSGGLQEETTALGVPCLTVRETTERPITVTEGTNRLAPDPAELPALVRGDLRQWSGRRPEGWDGQAGVRIVEALRARL